MTFNEMHSLLSQVGYGHLACVRDNRPYIVPIQYIYDEPNIYIFTTVGMKTSIVETNPEICLQVEEVLDERNWRSVIINGRATKLTGEKAEVLAQTFIKGVNPALTPMLHEKWLGLWASSESVSVIYQIYPDLVTGRQTVQ